MKTMAWGPISSRQINGENLETVTDFIFLGSKITVDGDCKHEIKRCLLFREKKKINYMTNIDSDLKSKDITLPTRVPIVKTMVFSSSHVWMWELDYKGSWGLKNWCFRTVALEKTLRSPLDSKNIKPVNPKGNQPLIFIGRSGAEAEAPILWPLGAKSQLAGKDPDAGKDWGQEEKWVIEDEMVTWTDWLSELEFDQTQGDSEGQKCLACCSSWVSKSQTWLRDRTIVLYKII